MEKLYQLNYEGEIRFGPTYYSLQINGNKLSNYFYGFSRSELGGGRYLAIEEWLTTDYKKGPITRVAIFDFKKMLVTRLKVVDQGFVSSFKIKDGVFSYRKEFHAKTKVVEADVDWQAITEWLPIINS